MATTLPFLPRTDPMAGTAPPPTGGIVGGRFQPTPNLVSPQKIEEARNEDGSVNWWKLLLPILAPAAIGAVAGGGMGALAGAATGARGVEAFYTERQRQEEEENQRRERELERTISRAEITERSKQAELGRTASAEQAELTRKATAEEAKRERGHETEQAKLSREAQTSRDTAEAATQEKLLNIRNEGDLDQAKLRLKSDQYSLFETVYTQTVKSERDALTGPMTASQRQLIEDQARQAANRAVGSAEAEISGDAPPAPPQPEAPPAAAVDALRKEVSTRASERKPGESDRDLALRLVQESEVGRRLPPRTQQALADSVQASVPPPGPTTWDKLTDWFGGDQEETETLERDLGDAWDEAGDK